MKLYKKDGAQKKPVAQHIAIEIDQALVAYTSQKQQKAKGLVLGLLKFKKLKEQCAASLPEQYQQMAIIVDTTQQSRISVF